MLSYIIFITSTSADDKNQIDSINLVLKSDINDSSRSILYFELFENYIGKNKRVEAGILAQKLIDSIEQNNIIIKSWELFYFANYYRINQQYDTAKKYYLLALKYYEKTDNFNQIAECYSFLAYVSNYQGFNNEAIDYCQKQYLIAKKYNLIDQEIDAFIGIGFNYIQTGDFHRAYDYMNDAYLLAKANNRKRNLMIILMDFGMIKTALREFEAALKYHFEALELAKEENFEYLLPFNYVNIGDTYFDMGNHKIALEYYTKTLELFRLRKDKSNVLLAIDKLGYCYKQLGDSENALRYYFDALQLAFSLKAKYIISSSYRNLAELYFQSKNYNKAYDYIKFYKVYNDSVKIENNIKTLAEIQTKFEKERNESQAKILFKQNEIDQLKLNQKRYWLVFLSVISILLIIISLIILKRNKMRYRKKIVELTQQNLRNQMNPHFIFNTLNSIQYYLFKNNKILSNNYLSKFTRLLNLVFENSKHKSIPINEEIKALELYLELEKLRFKEKLNYEIKVDENIDILDYKIPPLILQPFVENAILHGIMPKQDNGKIELDFKLKSELIICSIKDNGIGREKAMEIKMEKENTHKSLGTKISEDRLKNLNLLYRKKLRIDYIDLKDEYKNPLGTEVLLRFPITS